MSTVQLDGPDGKGASGTPGAGSRGKKLVVNKEKKKTKQPIVFSRDSRAGKGAKDKTESSNEKDSKVCFKSSKSD